MQCRICGGELEKKGAVSCMKCDAPFHRDCWIFNGMCGIYGCGCRAYVGFRESTDKDVVKITEETGVPLALQTYVEAMMRVLPRWGRLLIPSVGIGMAGTLVVCLLYFSLTAMPFSWMLTSIFFGCGALSALFAVPLGGTILRYSTRVAQATGILALLLYGVSRSLVDTPRALFVAACVVVAMVMANALSERVMAPYRYSPRPGPFFKAIARPLLTGFVLFGFLALLTVLLGPFPVVSFLDEIACISVFGLFAAAPPLELSKSAFMKRMQREADEAEGHEG